MKVNECALNKSIYFIWTIDRNGYYCKRNKKNTCVKGTVRMIKAP